MIAKAARILFFVGTFLLTREVSAADEKLKKVEVKPPSTSVTTPSIPKIPKLPLKVPEIPPRHPDPSIVEIQKQLQDIVKIQQTLQLQHDQQIAEIQRIVAQAQAHQKLLNDLAKVRQSVREDRQNQIEEALRRQKIQLIEEQAIKNQAVLEKFKEEKISREKSEKEKLEKEKKPKKNFGWWNPQK